MEVEASSALRNARSPIALREVLPYLLGAGILTADQVVDGGLTIKAHRRRNRSFSIRWGPAEGVFLKQLTPVADSGRTELLLYGLARGRAAEHPALGSLPRAVRLDAERDIVVVELLQPDQPIWTSLVRTDTEAIAAFARLGATLAGLHAVLASWERPPGATRRPWADVLPWGFCLHELSVSLLRELSPANAKLLRILLKAISPATAAAARGAWRPSTVVHHDLKTDNVLTPAAGAVPRIVDWELAGWGDPAWDIATMWQSLLGMWLDDQARDDRVDPGTSALSAVQTRCAAFWSAYVASSGLGVTAARSFRWRASLFSAYRLVQSAYESGHRMDRLGRFAVLAAQVAVNVLEDPDRAASELYGVG